MLRCRHILEAISGFSRVRFIVGPAPQGNSILKLRLAFSCRKVSLCQRFSLYFAASQRLSLGHFSLDKAGCQIEQIALGVFQLFGKRGGEVIDGLGEAVLDIYRFAHKTAE